MVLIANPSGDVYGSDLQLLESVSALIDDGIHVIVVLGRGGPLVERLDGRGAEVRIMPFPLLQRAGQSVGGVFDLVRSGLSAIRRIRRLLRDIRPDAVYVNTVTIPWWLVAARLTGTPSICHVHEAELNDGRLVRFALNAPLLLASRIIVISRSAREATVTAVPWLRRRMALVYNGVPQPPDVPTAPEHHAGPTRIAVVARLSPRKAPDVALDAVGLLRGRGHDVEIDVCGTPFSGYEWYETQLRQRAAKDDLKGSVHFSGYVSPIWSALNRADIVAAPSLREPFGNAVVEAQLARRPVVASAALGHLESIVDGETGLLVPPNDAMAMADAIQRLIENPELSDSIAKASRATAVERFSVTRYRSEILTVVAGALRRRVG